MNKTITKTNILQEEYNYLKLKILGNTKYNILTIIITVILTNY